MSSRSLSPPRRRRRGCDDDHRAEPSITSLYLYPNARLSFQELLHMSPARPSSPPPPRYDSFDQSGLHAVHQPQHHGESGSGSQPQHHGESGSGSQPQQQEDSLSDFELDSPPRITVLAVIEDEPRSPTSPSRGDSPLSMDMNPALSPTFETDTDEHDLSDEEDPYFKSSVDNFVTAVDDVCKPNLPVDNIDKMCYQRQSDLYANSALMHYNNEEKNKVKYKLVRAVTSCGIVGDKGCCGHVNFIAKGDQENSEEELFFAELRSDGYMSYATTCVISLKGVESVGGLCGTRYDYFDFSVEGLRIDAQHCYACSPWIKHPKNGLLYESGHVPCSDYYFG